MHIESLKVFCDLIDTRSFSKAAARNFISQSAVSQQVRAFEDRFGKRLVERSRGGGLVPTPAGLVFYQGCMEIVESWEDNVHDGRHTDFRRAVAAKPGEKIVFSWQVWPDKATVDRAEARMREDKRLEVSGEIPFDARRLIYGGFEPIFTMGRG